MSNNNNRNKIIKNQRTVLSVKEQDNFLSARVNGKCKEEEIASLSVLVANIAAKYGVDVLDVLDDVDDCMYAMYQGQKNQNQVNGTIFETYVDDDADEEEYDLEDEFDNDSPRCLYNADEEESPENYCMLPDDEVPLYITSYSPSKEQIRIRPNCRDGALGLSIESVLYLICTLSDITTVPIEEIVDELADIIYGTEENEEEVTLERKPKC